MDLLVLLELKKGEKGGLMLLFGVRQRGKEGNHSGAGTGLLTLQT